jgi:hypothetical protein
MVARTGIEPVFIVNQSLLITVDYQIRTKQRSSMSNSQRRWRFPLSKKRKKLVLDCCRFEIDLRGNLLEMTPRPEKCRDC